MHGPTAARDPAALGAEPLHLRDRRLDHAAERALPAGMGGADHARLAVGEQDRRAVGGEDAEREAGPVGDHRVGAAAGHRRARARSTSIASAEWTWWTVTSLAPGRDRFDRAPAVLARSPSRSSPEPRPTLRPAQTPSDTPPRRPRKPCGTPPSAAARIASTFIQLQLEPHDHGPRRHGSPTMKS